MTPEERRALNRKKSGHARVRAGQASVREALDDIADRRYRRLLIDALGLPLYAQDWPSGSFEDVTDWILDDARRALDEFERTGKEDWLWHACELLPGDGDEMTRRVSGEIASLERRMSR